MAANQSPDRQPNTSTLEEIRATRIEKIQQIKDLGLNPFAYKWEVTHNAAELQEKQTGTNPTLIRIDINAGHGAGKSVAATIQENVDIQAFTLFNMGVVLLPELE